MISFYLVCFILTICSWSAAQVDFSQPVNATVYQKEIKQGFATNYFKTDGQINETTLEVATKYRTKNIQDIYDIRFRNVRLRCRPELYNDDYTTPLFQAFLDKLEEVVDECIEVGVAPIISWEHHAAEANATAQARSNYIDWWTRVAEKLKHKNYHLSYNLFTELGIDVCRKKGQPIGNDCDSSLRGNKTAYEDWTSSVIAAIRETGENNEKRVIILGSPEKTAEGLGHIQANMLTKSYMNEYIMVEWHEYAAGPSCCDSERPRYWSGNGNDTQKRQLKTGVDTAKNFTRDTGIPTYFGAWMPRDNKDGGLNQTEVENFARFFVELLKSEEIPWSLNVIDNYYRTRLSKWLKKTQTFGFNSDDDDGDDWEELNMADVLYVIRDAQGLLTQK